VPLFHGKKHTFLNVPSRFQNVPLSLGLIPNALKKIMWYISNQSTKQSIKSASDWLISCYSVTKSNPTELRPSPINDYRSRFTLPSSASEPTNPLWFPSHVADHHVACVTSLYVCITAEFSNMSDAVISRIMLATARLCGLRLKSQISTGTPVMSRMLLRLFSGIWP
jgi:hypothetical protein